MCKFVASREDLGSRVTGYTLYDSATKGFVGMTTKAIIDALRNSEVIYGFKLDGDDLAFDDKMFHQTNLMVRTGINNYRSVIESDIPVNNMYTVVRVVKTGEEITSYEVITSRHARLEVTPEKLKGLIEMGVVQGGAWLDSKGKIVTAKCLETT